MSTPMSDDEKAELLRLANAATPGPWHHGFHDGDGRGTKSEGSWIVTIPSGDGVTVIAASDHDGFKTGVKEPRDADYIAAANPGTVKALLDELAALARERDELRAVVEKLPVTADGKPALPGATVYCPSGHPVALALVQKMVTCQHDECYDDTIGDKHQIRYEVTRCYSSPEAALAKPPTS